MNGTDLVRRFTEEFKNQSNFDIVDDLMSEDFVHHLLIPGIPAGRDGMKALGKFVTGAVHDITVTIDLIVCDGDLIANRNSARGVRTADGTDLTWTEHEFWRTRDGRLVEQWSVAAGLGRRTVTAYAR
jgi:ketosteroid isomerase-like protein